ncbi:MAG: Na/Pi cotransporter family protein [Candidatus Desulforudis sp.]|nr:Na/Pi cotransporter family protein [Desulforudis sp.]
MWVIIVFGLLGGMGLLLYGMHVLSEGLQKIAGHKLRGTLGSITRNRFLGLGVGSAVTILFQSSTATTVILVGLASAGVMSLRQTLPIVLGADIGTTVTAQLIALKVTEIALPIVAVGASIIFFTRRDRYRRIGQVFLGFGLLFLGLKIMGDAMYPLRDEPFLVNLLTTMSDYPFLAIIAGAVFTFLVHSSAAAVGIIMLLAMQDLVTLNAAIYLLFGANIGTSFTAILSSLGSSREAQRVALAHFLFKLAGVLLFLPFVNPFAYFITSITGTIAYQVANVHTFFNIAIALLFLPFTDHFATLLNRVLPDRESCELDMRPKYLDETIIASSPSLALGLATREILRTYDLVYYMTSNTSRVFERNDRDLLDTILHTEEKVDTLARATKSYLANVLRQPLSRLEFQRCMGLVHVITDLEHIGDIIEKSIADLAECKMYSGCDFSDEGWEELKILHQRICNLMEKTHEALATNNAHLADTATRLQPKILIMERKLRQFHIHRLRIGVQKSEATSSIHLDLINAYVRISEHVRNIAVAIVEEVVGIKSPSVQDEMATATVTEADETL